MASEATQQAKRARKAQNNVSLSLSRMARVKSSATAWLKTIDRGNGTGDTPVSVNVHVQPPTSQLTVTGSSGKRPREDDTILVGSPLPVWSPGPHAPGLLFSCSFCTDMQPVEHVRYNAMLPHSYVLLCGACSRRER